MAKVTVELIEKDHGWKTIKKEITKNKKPYVKIGVLSGAGKYEGGENANIADVAIWNEFGTKDIHPRPFMAQTFDSNGPQVDKFIKAQYNLVLGGKQTVDNGLKKIGVFYEGKVKLQFVKGDFKANAPATIKKKTVNGKVGNKPLIDTGHLRQSITHEVVLTGGKK